MTTPGPHSSWFVGQHDRLRDEPPRIVLSDGGDDRAVAAAELLLEAGVAEPILIRVAGTTGPAPDPRVQLIEVEFGVDPLEHGLDLVAAGEADCLVGGAVRPTADILRASIRKIGLEPDVDLVSSSFLMILPDRGPVVFADCAVVPEPTAEQLATIAHSGARTLRELTGETPRVAMLSFSTHGSAEHDSVAKVRQATAMLREREPDLVVDGELQFDAAYDAVVATRKAPDSAVAGQANVFVFPSLDAGNIAYKIAERMGGATALGPLLQGLAKPVHDLSRGCSAEDIFEIAVIAGLEAIGHKEPV